MNVLDVDLMVMISDFLETSGAISFILQYYNISEKFCNLLRSMNKLITLGKQPNRLNYRDF